MPEKKKRKYTFRKNQPVPFESGSIMHEAEKARKKSARDIASVLEPQKKRKRKK